MWFEKKDPTSSLPKIIISMPGVPHEMKGLMQDAVIPQLKELNREFTIHHRTLLTAGAGESFIAERLKEWEAQLPSIIKLAYLPNYGMVRLRLTIMGSKNAGLESMIEQKFVELQELLKDIVVITEDAPLEKALSNLLIQKGKSLATAESCTGGYIAHLLTSMPGASAYFKGSVIAYDNSIKQKLLDVTSTTLHNHGAVSKEAVSEMLQGLLSSTEADYGIAVSGIMGPAGGTEEKPVGTVWIAVGSKNQPITTSFHFRFDRQRNIQLTAANAMLLMWKFIHSDR
jgi:nicotinamide-nucleotide amidase